MPAANGMTHKRSNYNNICSHSDRKICHRAEPTAAARAAPHDETKHEWCKPTPRIGRFIRPEEVAAAAPSCLQAEAGTITGQQMIICSSSSL
jgi:NAD(P)-dependent dehydrogenase (short-subunit alcohol dehydrogenase family)